MKMKLRTAVLLLLTTIAISACTQSTTVGINNVDAQSFLAKITDSSVTVIDVRSAEEYAEGHLANSININVESDGKFWLHWNYQLQPRWFHRISSTGCSHKLANDSP
jgi:predicted sulfurtransferase